MLRSYDFPEEKEQRINITANGTQIPVYRATVSKYPLNRRWPGHQRPLDQTETAYFAYVETDEKFICRFEYQKDFENVVIRPLSKNIKAKKEQNTVVAEFVSEGKYTVELDGVHNALHLFVNKPRKYDLNGDVIRFEKGVHEVGEIVLKSGQTLFIDEGAIVYGTVFAENAENITVCGHGILDASHHKEKILFEANKPEQKGFAVRNAVRTHTVRFNYCKNVTVKDITIRDSLVYTICPICTDNISIDNVNIIGNWRYNSDGIDMHNCANVNISNCFIRTFDDSLCVKGFDYLMKEEDMLRNGIMHDTFNNVTVSNCVIWCDWGRSLEIGAETRAREISNITFANCDLIHNSYAACDVQNVDYADVHNIVFENINVEYDDRCYSLQLQETDEQKYDLEQDKDFMPNFLCTSINYIPEYSKSATERGRIRDILFKNINVFAKKMPPILFEGYDNQNIESVTVENIFLNGEKINSTDSIITKHVDNLIIK